MSPSAVPDVIGVAAWEPTVVAGLGAPTIGPDNRPLVASVLDSSPSQERLGRIAAMLRDAEHAMSAPVARERRGRREPGARGLRPAA
jgi:hypothetical protein